MTFKEYLVSTGLTEEQADKAIAGMDANKFYLASEEKLEERYKRLKEQKEQSDTDLEKANNLVEDLKKSNKSNEDLQAAVEAHKAENEKLVEERAKDRKQAAIDLGLTKLDARNFKSVYPHLDYDKIEVTDDGVKGLDEQLESLTKDHDYLFQKAEDPEKRKEIVTDDGLESQNNGSKDPFDAKLAKYTQT